LIWHESVQTIVFIKTRPARQRSQTGTKSGHNNSLSEHTSDAELLLDILYFLFAFGACPGAVALKVTHFRLILNIVRIGYPLAYILQRLAYSFPFVHRSVILNIRILQTQIYKKNRITPNIRTKNDAVATAVDTAFLIKREI